MNSKLSESGALLFPTLHLYGLAIELGLKAFLLQRGCSLSQVRRISHSLSKALKLARRRKLGRVVKLSRFDLRAILILDITYSSNQLRYIELGSTKVPTVSQLATAAERIVGGVEHFCTGFRRLNRNAG